MGNKLELKYFNRPVQQKHMFWLSGGQQHRRRHHHRHSPKCLSQREREMQPGLECTPTNTHVEGLIYGEQFCCCCRGLTVEQDQLRLAAGRGVMGGKN